MLTLPLLFVTVIFVYLLIRFLGKKRDLPLPPGPKPLPFIGNLLDLPSESLWLTYDKWFTEFQSDIIHVTVAGKDIIILKTYEVAVDLLEKRSSIYSSRAHGRMTMELMGWDNALNFLPYGNYWKRQRRLLNEVFNEESVKGFEPIQGKAVLKLLLRLINQPNNIDVIQSMRQMMGEIVLPITYGRDVQENDPFVDVAQENFRAVSRAVQPGAFWVEFLPWLKYAPRWLEFQRFAEHARQISRVMIETPFKATKQQMSTGNYPASFVSASLEKLEGAQSDLYYDENTVKHVASIIYAASAETTLSTMGTLALCLVNHPDIQKKAQAEIDEVLNGSFPTFQHQAALPYVTAIVLEALRWHPVTPFGNPHQVISEDIYNGYRIPANSLVFPNVWSMVRDESIYPNPEVFNPDRFITDGKLNTEIRDPRLIAFGFGRRICPGRYLAFSAVWIAAASMLATLEFSKAKDENGHIIEPSGEYEGYFLTSPKPFKCSIKPRSAQAEAFIRGEPAPTNSRYLKRVMGLVRVDSTCAAHKDEILAGMTLAHVIAALGHNVNATNPAFKHFFDADDEKKVQEMYRAITTTAYTHHEFTIRCPAEGGVETFNDSYTTDITLVSREMNVSPALFSDTKALATMIPPTALVSAPQIVKDFTVQALGYAFLQELSGYHKYGTAAGWKSTFCGKNLSTASCAGPLPSASNRFPLIRMLEGHLKQSVCFKRGWDAFEDGKSKSEPTVPRYKNRSTYPILGMLLFAQKAFPTQQALLNIAIAQLSSISC